MSQILKTITASFETVDLAELAAKNIKNHFDEIKAITIKYKNYPESNQSHHTDYNDSAPLSGMAALSASNYNMPSSGFFPGFFQANIPAYLSVERDALSHTRFSGMNHDIPEIETTTESRLIIKASEEEVAKIESQLRGMGGQQIVVS